MIKILRDSDYRELDDISDFNYDDMASSIIDKLAAKDELFAKFIENDLNYYSLTQLESKLEKILADTIKSVFDGQ